MYSNFDTCNSNVGKDKGALVFIHNEHGEMLDFPCRLHIYELPLSAVVIDQFGKSSSPKAPGLSELENLWKTLGIVYFNFDNRRNLFMTNFFHLSTNFFFT